MKREELVAYLDDYLRLADFQDYGPQGLQVEAEGREVRRVALAVDSAPAVIEAAAAWRADMLLAHHGIFWGGVQRIAGAFGQRVRLLLKQGINLYAAHLCLDAHPEVGNNASLARLCGVAITDWWGPVRGEPIGAVGSAPAGATLAEFVETIESALQTSARVLPHGPASISRVAILSGLGIDQAAGARETGADTFLTGETSHANYWAAADYGLNVIFAGHYATETVGVKALGAHLAQRFDLEVKFFDFPTGM